MGQVYCSCDAERDLDVIWHYLADKSVKLADYFLDRVDAQTSLLSDQPRIGHRCDHLIPGLRAVRVLRSPYVIYYRPEADGITIVRVLHGARDIPKKFDDEHGS